MMDLEVAQAARLLVEAQARRCHGAYVVAIHEVAVEDGRVGYNLEVQSGARAESSVRLKSPRDVGTWLLSHPFADQEIHKIEVVHYGSKKRGPSRS